MRKFKTTEELERKRQELLGLVPFKLHRQDTDTLCQAEHQGAGVQTQGVGLAANRRTTGLGFGNGLAAGFATPAD